MCKGLIEAGVFFVLIILSSNVLAKEEGRVQVKFGNKKTNCAVTFPVITHPNCYGKFTPACFGEKADRWAFNTAPGKFSCGTFNATLPVGCDPNRPGRVKMYCALVAESRSCPENSVLDAEQNKCSCKSGFVWTDIKCATEPLPGCQCLPPGVTPKPTPKPTPTVRPTATPTPKATASPGNLCEAGTTKKVDQWAPRGYRCDCPDGQHWNDVNSPAWNRGQRCDWGLSPLGCNCVLGAMPATGTPGAEPTPTATATMVAAPTMTPVTTPSVCPAGQVLRMLCEPTPRPIQ